MEENKRLIISIVIAIAFLAVLALLVRALLPDNTVQVEVYEAGATSNTNTSTSE